ncbi:MAG: PepSY domain-containing protein [Candidatus Aenigmatarchaeota archaeon]|nr:MAG: PepSY domain-containing protein [Candidatus Aenigmarchaeota archaeon]
MKLADAVKMAEDSADVKALKARGAFFCSAYVMLNPKQKIDAWNLSYYVPKTGKMVPVAVSEKGVATEDADVPLHEKTYAPFDKMPETDEATALQTALRNAEESKIKPVKIILAVQKNGMEYWNVTFLEASGMALNVRIDAHSGEVLLVEKSNLMSGGKQA